MAYRDPPEIRRESPRAIDVARERRLLLPLLDNLRVASPCPQSWDEMDGDERVRHCWRCDQDVYNLSELTREQAEALVFAREAPCARASTVAADGTILTSDCPPGRRRYLALRGLFGALVAAVLAIFCRALSWPKQAAPLAMDFVALSSHTTGIAMIPPPPPKRNHRR